MTTVYYDRANEPFKISITGHAGSAPAGQDLICAAVSMLTYTLIKATQDRDEFDASYYVDVINGGHVDIECEPQVGFEDALQIVFDTVLAGFQVLAEREPEYVEIKEECILGK